MKILFFGDVFSRAGRSAVAETLPAWKETHKPDVVVANVENAAGGGGVTPKILDELQALGVDAFTMGDHFMDQDFAKTADYPIVRPANVRGEFPGVGYRLVETALHKKLMLLNLLGKPVVRMEVDSYFDAADEAMTSDEAVAADAILVDMHASMTSEKQAMGFYLDGRVSAVVGTHTHVPTADTRILPKGTAFQSDVGMCGALNSVIGMGIRPSEIFLRRELGENLEKGPREEPERPYFCDAVVVEASGPTRATSITRLTSRPGN